MRRGGAAWKVEVTLLPQLLWSSTWVAAVVTTSVAFLLQPITVESSVSLTHQRLCDQKCHSPKHLYPLLSIQIRPNWFLVQAIERHLNHKCSLCDFPKSLLSSRWLNAAEPLLDIEQMSSNIITRPFATNSTMASALTNKITAVTKRATNPFLYRY